MQLTEITFYPCFLNVPISIKYPWSCYVLLTTLTVPVLVRVLYTQLTEISLLPFFLNVSISIKYPWSYYVLLPTLIVRVLVRLLYMQLRKFPIFLLFLNVPISIKYPQISLVVLGIVDNPDSTRSGTRVDWRYVCRYGMATWRVMPRRPPPPPPPPRASHTAARHVLLRAPALNIWNCVS